MKILHVCLAQFYIDNFGYQENILPKAHKLAGHEVEILASTETYIGTKLGYIKEGSYLNENQIKVTRIPYKKIIPRIINKKLRIYTGINKMLYDFNPDIIFIHDLQFLSIKNFRMYMKRNQNTLLFIDGHADFINSGRNWISKNILHKIIYRYCAKLIEPYTQRFYGVLPIRNDFLINVYKINPNKVELLPLGFDDSLLRNVDTNLVRSNVRRKLNLSDDDFVVVSGGKLDARKNIDQLLIAVDKFRTLKIKLIVFGLPTKETKDSLDNLLNGNNIVYVGWQNQSQIMNLMISSDIAVFPGTHSVLWEQAIGLGLPSILRKWKGIDHYDLGGNCMFLTNGDAEEIFKVISKIYLDHDLYKEMKKITKEKASIYFAYSSIAQKAIFSGKEINNENNGM